MTLPRPPPHHQTLPRSPNQAVAAAERQSSTHANGNTALQQHLGQSCGQVSYLRVDSDSGSRHMKSSCVGRPPLGPLGTRASRRRKHHQTTQRCAGWLWASAAMQPGHVQSAAALVHPGWYPQYDDAECWPTELQCQQSVRRRRPSNGAVAGAQASSPLCYHYCAP